MQETMTPLHQRCSISSNGCTRCQRRKGGGFTGANGQYSADRQWLRGQIDALFTDSCNCYHMVDWKRYRESLDPDAKIEYGRMGKPPLEMMIDSQYNH